jgi:hypothetical protein
LTTSQNEYFLLSTGRQLMELIPDEEARWALLESFWCEILLYAAPSDNLKAHKKAIAHGTELVTLDHPGIAHARWDRYQAKLTAPAKLFN